MIGDVVYKEPHGLYADASCFGGELDPDGADLGNRV